MRHYRAVIFDLDGVLVDSEALWKLAEREVFGAVGVPVREDGQASTASMTTREVTQYWFERHPWNGPSLRDIEQAVVERAGELVTDAREIPGSKALVAAVHARGLNVGLATNAPDAWSRRILSRLRIEQFFQHVQSAEHVARGKPAPDVYLAVAAALSVASSECLAIEDTLTGARAARAAGMDVVVVPSDPADTVELNRIGAIVLPGMEAVEARVIALASWQGIADA